MCGGLDCGLWLLWRVPKLQIMHFTWNKGALHGARSRSAVRQSCKLCTLRDAKEDSMWPMEPPLNLLLLSTHQQLMWLSVFPVDQCLLCVVKPGKYGNCSSHTNSDFLYIPPFMDRASAWVNCTPDKAKEWMNMKPLQNKCYFNVLSSTFFNKN